MSSWHFAASPPSWRAMFRFRRESPFGELIPGSATPSAVRTIRRSAAAQFIGYRIIADAAGLSAKPVSEDAAGVELNDPRWNGYLANISPREFREHFESLLPESMAGSDFLARYGGTTERVTHVDPSRRYAVRKPTAHPIEENARVARFHTLLQGSTREASLREMGDLMAASHASYSACGLGSDGTDLLVELVRNAGEASGLYGAKITGGGSGGTVAILGRDTAEPAIETIARQYSEQTGRHTYVFRGSSNGACYDAASCNS